MTIIKILLLLLLLVSSIGLASATPQWAINSSEVTGLSSTGASTNPTIFQKDSVWRLIAGQGYGDMYGWTWNGSAWVSNSSEVSGIGNIFYQHSTVFYRNNKWVLIIFDGYGSISGYNWVGSSWTSNSSEITGLISTGAYTYQYPTAFYKDSKWKMIVGKLNGDFDGYTWNGSYWVTNSSEIVGLGDIGTMAAPKVFQRNTNWTLIGGSYNGGISSFTWNGTAWVSNSTEALGISSANGLDVVSKNGVWTAITNNGGAFTGYTMSEPVPFNLSSPSNNSVGVAIATNLKWNEFPRNNSYTVVLSTDSTFTNIVLTESISCTSGSIDLCSSSTVNLNTFTNYWWKVTNGLGNVSQTWKFTTGGTPVTYGYINVTAKNESNISEVINTFTVYLTDGISLYNTTSTTSGYINFTGLDTSKEYSITVTSLGYASKNYVAYPSSNTVAYLFKSTEDYVTTSFYLVDITNTFNYRNTKLSISRIVNSTSIEVSRSYFDAASKNSVNLLRGISYALTLENSEVKSIGNYIPTASGTDQLTVGNISYAPATQTTFWVNFTKSNTSLMMQWDKGNRLISAFTYSIYNGTGSLVYQIVSTANTGSTTYPITNSTDKYHIVLTANTLDGVVTLNEYWIPDIRTKIGNSAKADPSIVGQETYDYISVFLIIFFAGLSGAMHSTKGTIFVAGLATGLYWYSWASWLNPTYIGTIWLIAIVLQFTDKR